MFLVVCGTIALVLGVIGIVMPVLPTTPFLLLASFCYVRSSEKLYKWLMSNRVLGRYIYNYVHYRAIDKKTKIGTLIFLWITLFVSMYLVDNLHIRCFLVFVGLCVSIHILLLKTLEGSVSLDDDNDNFE